MLVPAADAATLTSRAVVVVAAAAAAEKLEPQNCRRRHLHYWLLPTDCWSSDHPAPVSEMMSLEHSIWINGFRLIQLNHVGQKIFLSTNLSFVKVYVQQLLRSTGPRSRSNGAEIGRKNPLSDRYLRKTIPQILTKPNIGNCPSCHNHSDANGPQSRSHEAWQRSSFSTTLGEAYLHCVPKKNMWPHFWW